MVKHRPYILLCNDDGIHAAGIQAMRGALMAKGYRTVAVAPDRGVSGASRSISLNRPLTMRRLSDDQYSVDGSPVDCIMMALYEILRGRPRPAMVISGINHGPNLADDVSYSGTCAAAAEGCVENIRSVSVSTLPDKEYQFHFEDHARFFVERILPRVEGMKMPRWSYVNVNFPACPRAGVKGIRVVPLGRTTYAEPIRKMPYPRTLGRDKDGFLYWISGHPNHVVSKGTDLEAVRRGYAAVSPVRIELNDAKLLAAVRRRFA